MKKILSIIVFLVFVVVVSAQINVDTYGKVGIGTSTPTSKLNVYNNGVTEIKLQASSSNVSRFWALNSVFAIGFGIDGSGYGHIYSNLNSPTELMTFYNGRVGIGRVPSSSFKLDVNGSIRVNTTTYSSDLRLKKNIKEINEQRNDIFKLVGVSYNLNNSENIITESNISSDKQEEKTRIHYGLIAQDVQKILPDLVYADDEGFLSIDYVSIIPFMIEAMKDQQTQIDALKKQLDELSHKTKN
jgi:hypothetical protein